MVAYTTTYNLAKPTVGDDEDAWGGYLNSNFDTLESLLKGTTALTAIDVSGTITANGLTVNSGGDQEVYFGDATDGIALANTGAVSSVEFGNSQGTAAVGKFTYDRATGKLVYAEGANGSEDDHFAIDGTGKVGIQTTSPRAPLHVAPTGAASDNFNVLVSQFRPNIVLEDLSTSATDFQLFADGNELQFRYGDASTDTKLATEGMALNSSGDLSVSGKLSITDELTISDPSPQIRFSDSDHDDFWIHVNSNRFYVLADRDGNGAWETPHPLELDASTNVGNMFGSQVWTAGNDGSGSGLDADTVDGLQATSFLRSDAADSWSGTLTGTGAITTSSGYIEAGRGSGSMAMTINDGGGNANLTFNHRSRIPDVNGQAGRIQVNVDATTGEGLMTIQTSSAPVTAGTAVNLTTGLAIAHDYIEVPERIRHQGDTDTYIEFVNNTINFRTANQHELQLTSSGVFLVNSSLHEDYDALSGTSVTIDPNTGGAWSLTMTGNTTFTFGATTSNYSVGLVVELTGNGGTVTWPTSVDWAGGTAPDAPASGETDIYVFWTRNGGTTWYGVQSIDAAA